MNVIEQIRQWEASADEWAELADLCQQTETAPPGDPRWERMAALCESYADRLEQSRLVRMCTTGEVTPASLRLEAAMRRSGLVPS